MRFLISLALIAFFSAPVFAEETKRVITLKRADPSIKLDNGRTYSLVNNTVIEELDIDDFNRIRRNVFDFENGIVFHEVSGDSCRSTPFAQLPPGRPDEVRQIGCEIADDAGLLVKGKDDVRDFLEKFCKQP